jgi:hypothetical protein
MPGKRTPPEDNPHTGDSRKPTEPVSRDPHVHALEALDNANIGNSIVTELHEYIDAIVELSRDDNFAANINYRRRISVIAGIAKRALHHAEDMQGLMESLAEKAQGSVDMLAPADSPNSSPKGGA